MKRLWLAFLFTIPCVIVSAQNSGGNLPPHPAPNVSFGVTGLCLGDSTYFTNFTSQSPYEYNWYILNSDSDTIFKSMDINPVYLFPQTGTYTVGLIANNGHITSLSYELEIGNTPKAKFDVQYCTKGGMRFVSLSSCADSYKWIFEDGTTEDQPFIEHRFDSLGTHLVTLIASNGAVSDTVTDSITIYSLGFPLGTYTFTQQKDVAFFTPDDIDCSFYSWDFGDGVVVDTVSPVTIKHVFDPDDDIDIYNVILFVINPCGYGNSEQLIDTRQTTGLDDVGPMANLRLFPNPGHEALTLTGIPAGSDHHLNIYSSEGRLMLSKDLPPDTKDISVGLRVPPGVYVVDVVGHEGSRHLMWVAQ
ncbi:MAG: hypothetical protein H6585_14355 [Flavobacteriales bacterium]|nr:hypothetical protein [Flavobacteriales bacterium]